MAALAPLLEEWGIDTADIDEEHAEGTPEEPEEPATEPDPEEPPKRGKRD